MCSRIVRAALKNFTLQRMTLELSSRGSSPTCPHVGERRGICFYNVAGIKIHHSTGGNHGANQNHGKKKRAVPRGRSRRLGRARRRRWAEVRFDRKNEFRALSLRRLRQQTFLRRHT